MRQRSSVRKVSNSTKHINNELKSAINYLWENDIKDFKVFRKSVL
jgi:hypothetical protein